LECAIGNTEKGIAVNSGKFRQRKNNKELYYYYSKDS
jgi:hypothetical protein